MFARPLALAGFFFLGAAAAGCGAAAEPAAGPSSSGQGDSGKALAAQIDEGATVYKDHCASCHGTKGEGDSAPAIAGAAALPIAPPAGARTRKGEFKNAADVEAFVKSAMPIDAPGTLSDAQAFAVVAWELHQAGTPLGGTALDATTAPQVHVH